MGTVERQDGPEWHLARDGEQYGPYPFSVLVEAVKKEIVGRDDLVWRAGWESWRSAHSVAGLFAPPELAPGVEVSPLTKTEAARLIGTPSHDDRAVAEPEPQSASDSLHSGSGSAERHAPRVLELKKVGKLHGSEPAVRALVDVDLSVERGEWLSITGPSGAGKSTLLHVIGCLDRPTSGTFLLDDIDTAKLSDDERAGLRSQRIGFVFQSFCLLPYRTVLENVMLAEVYSKQSHRGREARSRAAIERVGLDHRAGFLPTKLSGGEQQRVAIARALVGRQAFYYATSRPEIWIRQHPPVSSICLRN